MKPIGGDAMHAVVARLRELVAALDRRTPRPKRKDETDIAAESADLREEATKRIAEIESEIRKLA
jgi:hypothetical protein